jgi:hypothetical protein
LKKPKLIENDPDNPNRSDSFTGTYSSNGHIDKEITDKRYNKSKNKYKQDCNDNNTTEEYGNTSNALIKSSEPSELSATKK